MSISDDINKAIEAIYTASASPVDWPVALKASIDLFGGAGATLEVFNTTTHTHQFFSGAGMPEAGEIEYFDHYMSINPRAAQGRTQQQGDIAYDDLVLPASQLEGDEFYTSFLAKHGLKYFISGCLIQTSEQFGVVTFQRTRQQGHVDAAELSLMKCLMPHFKQALDLSLRWQGLNQTKTALHEALEQLREGVIILDETGKAVHINQAAQSILLDNDGVAVSNAMLEIAQPEAMSRYETATKCATSSSISGTMENFEIAAARPSGKAPYVIAVRPYRNAEDRTEVIVFIRDPAAHSAGNARLLHQVFSLTDAETALALALVHGMSLRGYAEQKGLSINTIYTHYRRLKEKTGSINQAALIVILKDMTLPVI